MVTEIEREHVMNGKLDDLVEHQRRMDEERDAQVLKEGVNKEAVISSLFIVEEARRSSAKGGRGKPVNSETQSRLMVRKLPAK